MAAGESLQVLSFNVATLSRFAGTPVPANSFNQFDEHGLTLSLDRLREESNWEYRRRLFDVFSNRANAAYRGMVNGITRELGLSLFDAMQVNPKVSLSTGKFFAPNPYIKFDGVWLYLYSDYANDVLDYKIDRYAPGMNYEYMGKLADFINETTYFEAFVMKGVNPYTRSMQIINQSNRVEVPEEEVPHSTRFRLDNKRVVSGSVQFSSRAGFRREVASEAAIQRAGDYYIDYHEGLVITEAVPPVETAVRYEYSDYPFTPIASPVILHDINNENFKVKLFQQVLQDDGSAVHGMPTELGADVINELLSVYPAYFGK